MKARVYRGLSSFSRWSLGLGCGEQEFPTITAPELDRILRRDQYPPTDAAGLSLPSAIREARERTVELSAASVEMTLVEYRDDAAEDGGRYG
jgi:hypothetical protein